MQPTISLPGPAGPAPAADHPVPHHAPSVTPPVSSRPFKTLSREMAANRTVDEVGGRFRSAGVPHDIASHLAREELIKLGYPGADPDKSYMLIIDSRTGEHSRLTLTEMMLLNPQKNKSWFDLKTSPTEKIILLDSKGKKVTGIGSPLDPARWLKVIWDVDFKGYYLKQINHASSRPGYQDDKAFLNKSAFIKTWKLEYQSGRLSDSAMQLAARASGVPDDRLGDATSWSSLDAATIRNARPDDSVEIGLLEINGKPSTDLMTIRDKKTHHVLLWKPGQHPPLIEFSSPEKLKEYIAGHGHSPQKMKALLAHFSVSDGRTDHPFRNYVKAYGVEKAMSELQRGHLNLQDTIQLKGKVLDAPFNDMARRQTERLKSDADTLIVSDADAGEKMFKQRLSDINKVMFFLAPLAAVSPLSEATVNAAFFATGLTEIGTGVHDISGGKVSEGMGEIASGTLKVALSGPGLTSQGKTAASEAVDTLPGEKSVPDSPNPVPAQELAENRSRPKISEVKAASLPAGKTETSEPVPSRTVADSKSQDSASQRLLRIQQQGLSGRGAIAVVRRWLGESGLKKELNNLQDIIRTNREISETERANLIAKLEKFAPNISDSEPLKEYAEGGNGNYARINNYLRHGDNPEQDGILASQEASRLLEDFNALSEYKDYTYRAIKTPSGVYGDQIKKGDLVMDKAFLSTSLSPHDTVKEWGNWAEDISATDDGDKVIFVVDKDVPKKFAGNNFLPNYSLVAPSTVLKVRKIITTTDFQGRKTTIVALSSPSLNESIHNPVKNIWSGQRMF
ncbi:hypothetical protein GJV11_03630 [Enterobacteriaceae bacterium RIT693]|nr:hypothetical protein [Enterobacteriaceae bacterium RIT693]